MLMFADMVGGGVGNLSVYKDKLTDVKFCQFIKKLAQRIEVFLRGGHPF